MKHAEKKTVTAARSLAREGRWRGLGTAALSMALAGAVALAAACAINPQPLPPIDDEPGTSATGGGDVAGTANQDAGAARNEDGGGLITNPAVDGGDIIDAGETGDASGDAAPSTDGGDAGDSGERRDGA